MGMFNKIYPVLLLLIYYCCMNSATAANPSYGQKSETTKQKTVEDVVPERDQGLQQPSISIDSPVKYTQISYGTGHQQRPLSSLTNRQDEIIMKKFERIRKNFQEIIEFLRTDGHPGTPPSAGVGWFALTTAFILLSPMLIPLLLSPLLLVIGFLIFLPTIIESYRNGDE